MRRNAHYQETGSPALSGQVSAPSFMAVVTGNANGHGLVAAAPTAVDAGADGLGNVA